MQNFEILSKLTSNPAKCVEKKTQLHKSIQCMHDAPCSYLYIISATVQNARKQVGDIVTKERLKSLNIET